MSNANHGSVCQTSFHQSFGQGFKKKIRGKAVIADAFLLHATGRGFDIKSNRRRTLCIRIASPVVLQFARLVCIARAVIATMIAFAAWAKA
jgi:hypothetical protein